MEVQEAARRAKQFIAELFKEEDAQSIGLEEIELDGKTGTWRVTVGFSRPWNEPPFAAVLEPRRRFRDMKVVTLDDTAGQILSVKNRE